MPSGVAAIVDGEDVDGVIAIVLIADDLYLFSVFSDVLVGGIDEVEGIG